MKLNEVEELDASMAALANGDRDAAPRVMRALHLRALRFARAKLPLDQAEDVAQSILLRVFSRASEFTPGKPALPWFYAIAANELHSHRRRAAKETLRRAGADTEHLAFATHETPEREVLAMELRAALAMAIDDLDRPSAQAIAALLDENPATRISSAAFRKRVSRAYSKLRLFLGAHDEK